MKHLIDSSVWVALFLDFDAQHPKARQVVARMRGIIYVPYCVLAEVVTVLAYKHSKKQADAFLDYLSDNRDIKLISDSPETEIQFYRSISHRISFTDAALLHLSKSLTAKLTTFDQQLDRIARRGNSKTPTEP